jgi:hypothetical protein
MTWQYLTLDEQEAGRVIPDDYVWERLRLRRDQLLAASDFRMVPDAPWDVAPWQAYRAALRDLPDNTKDPRKAVWPVAP